MSYGTSGELGAKVMDSRDLEERLQELIADGPGQDLELIEERKALKDLKAETEWAGWQHGIGFIRDDYFEEYAEDFAESIGAIDREMGWPACHIDWAAAAESLQMDYSQVEVEGHTYWFREV